MNNLFYERYIYRNAEQHFVSSMLQFMLWHRGKFVPPHSKTKILQSYVHQVEEDLKLGIVNLPQLQFLVTTRCTLSCANCNAYIPRFGRKLGDFFAPHFDLKPDDFNLQMQVLEDNVAGIRRFILIGGEPLVHPQLYLLIERACKSPLVDVLEIVTNGTLIPGDSVLDVCHRFNEKVYFHISNYAGNPDLVKRLCHEKLVTTFNERDIKYQMAQEVTWYKEIPLLPPEQRQDVETTKKMFESCWLKRCLQVFDGKVAICPKASCGFVLGMAGSALPGETIDLRHGRDLRQTFLDFYSKDYFEVCRGCQRFNEIVLPAEQIFE